MTKMVPRNRADELVRRLTTAAGNNVQSIILYGSALSGEFRTGTSDINLLCILQDGSFGALCLLMPAMKWWTARRQRLPLFMTREELEHSADVFAIEFIDMKQHYELLFGEDVLKNLQIPMSLHRMQVEYELREKLLLLRQRALLTGGRERRLKSLLFESLPSFVTLFRHALIALGEPPSVPKREAVEILARRVGFEPTQIKLVLESRESKTEFSNIDVQSLFANYLKVIEQVVAAVDRMLDQERSSRPVVDPL